MLAGQHVNQIFAWWVNSNAIANRVRVEQGTGRVTRRTESNQAELKSNRIEAVAVNHVECALPTPRTSPPTGGG